MKFKRHKSKETKKTKVPLVLSRWEIIKRTIKQYKRNARMYVIASGVIMLPTAILRSYLGSQKSTTDLSIILFIASLVCVLDLFWLMHSYGPQFKKVRDSYVASTARILPFMAVAIIIGLFLAPSIAGVFFILFTVSYAQSLIFAILGVIMLLTAVFFVVRLSLALVAVVNPRLHWRSSLAVSWRISRKRWWYIFWNYVIYFVVIGIFSGLILELVSIIPTIGKNWFVIGFVNGLLLTVTLPVLVIYLTIIYRNLGGNVHEPE